MFIGVKTKILLTVLAIVLLFTFFSLLYFPSQQGRTLLSNYRNEVKNQAKTIAMGASIALSEQNFKGIKTAMDFVKENEELRFVALIQSDTQWNQAHTAHTIKDSVIVSFPDDKEFSIDLKSNDSLIVIRAPFRSSIMNGDIMLVVSTDSINKKQKKIWLTALLVSGIIFLIGMLIGLWLSRSISHPVQALRKAAKRVGEGDLTSIVENNSKDEIGELATAFNSMVKDIKKLSELTLAQEKEKQAMLASQNEALEKEVAERTKELRQSLVDLKATQSQLIQSEKMASLGELTAGIAHEIQNPLNFVNNFSEVNKELLDEMNEEIDKGNYEEVKIIAKDVTDNQEKINYHGKRADAIVKGMLQHSRSSSGQKEPTDINGLADEYLRLAYHGLRAKDKTFNATLKTEYDASIGNINIIPQDMGRVILNLITNAFYVVKEKKRETPNGYEPTVTVTTRKTKDKIIISVKDNGKGIPQKIVDKIFQPFFTTKPTGLGTGLGLSLSYDIVKAHGGELKVETKEGEGAEFIIILPS
ncbi:MAG: HAMP domain-containing protein [Chitinophagaceae bacterium]|jgi:signal transduction histidine kinase|nr:HAMP domain-containing protein [Chitinophagaceae bacterium]MBK8299961.1 HAMP domain-containing protein [Chitinophagaceae bacterium]MBK9464002.1 HAMP domain-containing protein [Chitinophagaceae bacterium]MBK9658876.1 HAMP domain-containing protein [Chitinophagaceae bacterium]MBK9939746.1 HAMP domain-containing protein [Chitinophagaceae bacterium]